MLTDLMGKFEIDSAKYAETNGVERDADWFLLKLTEEAGELVQCANCLSGRSRSKGFSEDDLRQMLADETADLLGHVLLFAHHNGLDMEKAIKRKWRFAPSE